MGNDAVTGTRVRNGRGLPGREAGSLPIISPVPSRVFAVANQKGGVGKTTTTVNLATALVQRGRRVLVVDCDPQANATSGLGVERGSVDASMYDVLVMGRPISEVRRPTVVPGLDIAPSSIALAGSEIELVEMARRRHRLAYALKAGQPDVDYVVIDCPPGLGLLTINAVAAAEALIVPVQCEYYALEGLGLLRHTVELLRGDLNPSLRIAGIVMTLFDSRLALAWQVLAEVRGQFPEELFETVIPRNVRLSEAPSHGLPVSLYDPACRGTHAYAELAAEFEGRLHRQARSGVAASGAAAPPA